MAKLYARVLKKRPPLSFRQEFTENIVRRKAEQVADTFRELMQLGDAGPDRFDEILSAARAHARATQGLVDALKAMGKARG